MREMQYQLYTPASKGYDNGFIAFPPHGRIKRKTPCYLVGIEGCHDKESVRWRKECGAGVHEWLLNFYRTPAGPHHYHCLFCGVARELRFISLSWGPRVAKDWIEKLEQDEDDPRSWHA